ncbi:Ger(x)C family spore germination protein [Sporolactobacillus putidus]|uniref:Germination protein GerC n=1 Tax=Sporolactobacillus putidus TaxID=492735 RepID=A0A917RXQ8_9BACL|nr:Ger(x)C family spore germination protein [Sporolactobacillus putidus]GGL42591.1 germination protein GerC [Sporolactobacillus putidus]
MKKSLVIIMMLMLLSGCIEDNIIDDILMAEAEGYDYIGNNQVIGTITTPNYAQGGVSGSGGGGLPATASMMSSATTVTYDGRSLAENLQPKGQKKIKVGKLRIMLFNEALLKHGFEKTIHFRNQDPEVGRDMYLAMVDGSTKDLLTATYQTAIPISRYVYDLIFQNQQQNFPKNNLSTFLYSYYGRYADPMMPIIKREKDHIVLTGIMFFKHDKYAGRINGQQKAFIFKTLVENFKFGFYDYTFQQNEHAVLENVSSSRQYVVKNGNSATPDIFATIRITGYVRQGSPLLKTKDYNSTIKRGMEKDLEKQIKKMVAGFQKSGIDPIELGQIVRSYTRHFDGASWSDRYPNARFHVKTKINIVETGVSQPR